jgi:hypothetical protein
MNAEIIVLTLLAIALAGMVYIIGTPWYTPKPHKAVRRRERTSNRRARR